MKRTASRKVWRAFFSFFLFYFILAERVRHSAAKSITSSNAPRQFVSLCIQNVINSAGEADAART